MLYYTILIYGYLKKHDSGEIVPNVVVFDHQVETPYNAALTEKLTALKNDIVHLIRHAPSISRGYVVEQAIADGWLIYSDDLIPTAGAYIYR